MVSMVYSPQETKASLIVFMRATSEGRIEKLILMTSTRCRFVVHHMVMIIVLHQVAIV